MTPRIHRTRRAAAALAAGLLISHLPAAAQDTGGLAAALERSRQDLTAALAELTRTRDAIAAEKPPLAASFEETELELREKRRLARIARMSRQDREMEMRQLERDRQTRRQDAAYLAGLLKDHALRVATLAGPGTPELAVDPGLLAATAEDPSAALGDRLAIIDASIGRLEALIGGSTAPGSAAAADGTIVEGTFAAAGPLVWFAAANGNIAGDISTDGTGIPRIGRADAAAVKAVLAGNEARLGLDVTGGSARALQEIDGGFTDLIRKGGLWIWPIMLLALLSLVFGIIKLAQFARFREPPEAWVNAILAALRVGDREKAKSIARDMNHPASPVMGKLVEVSDSSADLVEETLYEQLMGVQSRAGSMLPIIAVTAATSPLLGLLGTVSGMIATFNLITLFGSGDPKPLAGGISEALVTTLFGLVVAIPALILHAFLSRRSQGIVQTTERLGLSFVNALRAK
jgi:biopolymer transport protein ExbB